MNDTVRFFLHPRYFDDRTPHMGNATMSKQTCQDICEQAFHITYWESARYMREYPQGFWIHCRLDQFAVFIILRHHSSEVVNCVVDLKPTIIAQNDGDYYQQVANVAGVSRDDAASVLQAVKDTAPNNIFVPVGPTIPVVTRRRTDHSRI